MSTDIIEREIAIHAPIERVWTLVTEAEHLGSWFGDAGADIDLRPGGALEVRWDGHSLIGVVEAVDPTSLFAFRWQQIDVADGADLTSGNSTLVEFALRSDGDTTHVRVTESGFDSLDLPADQREGLYAGHTQGWQQETAELGTYCAAVAA
jgi:uncharacterized protein YndB with AHSA1/START domain